MSLFIASIIVLSFSAILLLLTAKSRIISRAIFLIPLFLGCALFALPALDSLLHSSTMEWRMPCNMPIGEFFIGIDPLSAIFLLSAAILFSLAGIYGYGYLKKSSSWKISSHFALYQLLLVCLILVVTAKNAVLFLIAWELLTLCAYFTIIYDDEKAAVRKAGYLYLIATHAGTFFLWAMFLIIAHYTGSFNFDQMANCSLSLTMNGTVFVFSLIGFGLKAGFIPLHIWLPHAHPAAPSHISAVLSGILIKIGIYGILRILFILKIFPEWCAIVLLAIGMISGIAGVLYALAQHEIKTLLAYHSIENIGIIAFGMGMGLWGQIHHCQFISIIGYAGALLHVFNHSIFKALLFLSAGSVIHATHSGEIDNLGGILKLMPWTGHLFLIGSLSICGLPFFNGFISEWLVYRSMFEGVFKSSLGTFVMISMGIVALALIGGLAAACFAKAFGVIFLGTSRSQKPDSVKEQSWLLRIPMIGLGAICVWIGLFPRTMVCFALNAAAVIYGTALSPAEKYRVIAPFENVIGLLMIVMSMMIILFLLKQRAMRILPCSQAKTWGCGYPAPTARMQYTASSFAQPLLSIFRNVLGYKAKGISLKGYFPQQQAASSQITEASETFLFKPLFKGIEYTAAKLKKIQYGHTQLYLLYFLIFLLTVLIWKMN